MVGVEHSLKILGPHPLWLGIDNVLKILNAKIRLAPLGLVNIHIFKALNCFRILKVRKCPLQY